MGKKNQDGAKGGYYAIKAAPSAAQRRALGAFVLLQDGEPKAKGKIPKEGDIRSQEEFGSTLKPISPPNEAKLLAEKVLNSIKENLTYARVDMIKAKDGSFLLMELELIEPCLYLSLHKKAPLNFVKALINS